MPPGKEVKNYRPGLPQKLCGVGKPVTSLFAHPHPPLRVPLLPPPGLTSHSAPKHKNIAEEGLVTAREGRPGLQRSTPRKKGSTLKLALVTSSLLLLPRTLPRPSCFSPEMWCSHLPVFSPTTTTAPLGWKSAHRPVSWEKKVHLGKCFYKGPVRQGRGIRHRVERRENTDV